MGPVDTGADSVEAVRRQLRGTWELVSLELFGAAGEKTSAAATGRLAYDEYGNLSMQGTVTGGPQIENSVLNVTGRVTIDPDTRSLRFTVSEPAGGAEIRLDPQLDASRVRYYEFSGDLLTTTLKNSAGATTARATWRMVR